VQVVDNNTRWNKGAENKVLTSRKRQDIILFHGLNNF